MEIRYKYGGFSRDAFISRAHHQHQTEGKKCICDVVKRYRGTERKYIMCRRRLLCFINIKNKLLSSDCEGVLNFNFLFGLLCACTFTFPFAGFTFRPMYHIRFSLNFCVRHCFIWLSLWFCNKLNIRFFMVGLIKLFIYKVFLRSCLLFYEIFFRKNSIFYLISNRFLRIFQWNNFNTPKLIKIQSKKLRTLKK